MEPVLVSRAQDTIGSPDAAADLYGLGVRIGFYLQALAMILYMYGDQKTYGKGLKVASGSVSVSVLASWFSYAARAECSPSEAIVVLFYLMSISFPAKYTLLNPRTIKGETIGVITLALTELATCAALLWTFATLVHTLPRLGTPNLTFFFAPVSLTGWFRYLALVYLVVDAITSLSSVLKMFRVLNIAWHTDPSMDELSESEMQKIQETIEWSYNEPWITIMLWLNLIFAVIAVETTLVWNYLTPLNDLRSPGQLIPFVTGLILFLDSMAVLARAHATCYTAFCKRMWSHERLGLSILRGLRLLNLKTWVSVSQRRLRKGHTDEATV